MSKLRPILIAAVMAALSGEVRADAPAQPDTRLPGVSLTEGVSQITGVAISPLLGVGALGAWKYTTTPEAQRALLPWYCHPSVWGFALVLIGLCVLKDVLGTAAPPLLKKPFDYLELFEDKASALVASTAFVPIVTSAMARTQGPSPTATVSAAELGFAAVPLADFPWMKVLLLTPLGIAIFAVVWLSFHAVNVLIALSPFRLIDASLKLGKLAMLGVLTLASFLSPVLGFLVCVPIILIACLVAGWSFRLTVFGTVYGWDLLSRRKASAEEVTHGVRGFTSQRFGDVPARTYCMLKVDEAGYLVARYRPWLMMPWRSIELDAMPDSLTRGMLHPSVSRFQDDGRSRPMVMLLPRYRSCVDEVGGVLGLHRITESALVRGLKAMKQWVVDTANLGRGAFRAGTARLSAPP